MLTVRQSARGCMQWNKNPHGGNAHTADVDDKRLMAAAGNATGEEDGPRLEGGEARGEDWGELSGTSTNKSFNSSMMAQLDESSVRQERPWKSLEMISDGLWFSLPLIGTLRKKKFAVNHPVDRHACHFFLSLSVFRFALLSRSLSLFRTTL